MPSGVYERTEEHKRKNSEAKKGENNPNYGKHQPLREKHGMWKDGLKKDSNDYLLFKVPEGCRFSCMKEKSGYVKVHRLTMAAFLNRPLKSKEVVHHINGDVTDNRTDNLKLMTNGEHMSLHNKLRRIKNEN